MVEEAKEAIRAGEAFQIVVSQRFSMPCRGRRPRRLPGAAGRNPSPYMYLLRLPHPDGTAYDVVGSSPEALVKVTGRQAITHPIAGSRPRGKTPEDDARLAEDLLADAKERAEHLMLVDLARNDLQRVCRPAPSTSSSSCRSAATATSCTSSRPSSATSRRAAAPTTRSSRRSRPARCAGRRSRAPWPHRRLRAEPRAALYGGVVGYLDFAGDLDMAIAIRTAVIKDGLAHVQAGAGHRRRLGAAPRVRGDGQQGRRRPARRRRRRGPATARTHRACLDRTDRRRHRPQAPRPRQEAGGPRRPRPAALLLGLTTRTWASGESRDVLSQAVTEVTGGAAAPGVVGLVAVCVVALLGLMTGGRVIRAVSAVVLVLASLGALAMTSSSRCARSTRWPKPSHASSPARRRPRPRVRAPRGPGPRSLVAALLAVGAVLTAVSSRSWAGLSGRYERGDKPASGPRGEVRTTWDELSEGRDPTLRDAPDET